jgi:aminodeoxyfutalosine deaminase
LEIPENVRQYLAAIPKAELHVHLEGAIQPETLLMLAKRNGVDLPGKNTKELRQWFIFKDFPHFAEIFLSIPQCLKTAEDYELVTYRFAAEMKRQNIRYSEVTFSPGNHHFLSGVDHDVYFSGLQRGRMRARADFGVEIQWVFDIVRDIADITERRKRADYTVKVAVEGIEEGVVALGLGGNETVGRPEQFIPWFDQARAAGLHSVPHAGEFAGPDSIREALRYLGAERIGHGVRSIEDPEVVHYLSGHYIPLEISPASNICLGVYENYEAHPLSALYHAGVPVTVNSDDPPLFNTTLNDNIELLFSAFHLSLNDIDEIILNGVRHSFLPRERKEAMETEFLAEMDRLRNSLSLPVRKK